MSYILEALKKAQAERQLGNAPDIHTPMPMPVSAPAPAARHKPLLLGLGAGIVIAGGVAVFAWRGQAPQGAGERAVLVQAAPAAAPAAVPAPVPAATPAPEPAVLPAAAAEPEPLAPEPLAPVLATPAKAPPKAADAAPPPMPAAEAPAPRRPPAPAPARDSAPEAVYLPSPAALAAAQQPRAPEPPIDENLRTLQQLPEAVQREVPKVAFGGYIYSPNPAERLLLVDKTLRHEGEEVAPGLVLERLLPKYAVMNYRGTRYRVGY